MSKRFASVVVGLFFVATILAVFAPAAAGTSFSANVRVNDVTAGLQMNASIAVSPAGIIYVAWEDTRFFPIRAVFYASSSDGGTSFGPSQAITPIFGDTRQKFPSVAVSDNGWVHVAWTDLTDLGGPSGSNIQYARLRTGQPTFDPAIVVSDMPMADGALDVKPRVATYGGAGCRVHLAWSTDEIAVVWDLISMTYDTSRDCGATFGPDLVLNPGGTEVSLDVATDGAVGIAYMEGASPNPRHVYFRLMQNDVWQAPVVVNDVPSVYHHDPTIALQYIPPADHRAHIAWADWRYATERFWWDTDIFYSQAISDPFTLFPDVRVLDTGVPDRKEQRDPWIGLDPLANPRIAWTDSRNDNPDVYFAESSDYGATFEPNLRVNDDASGREQSRPRLTDIGTEVGVVWQDERDAAGDLNVYFAGSGEVTLELCDLPGYGTDGVEPDTGTVATTFTFCVTYRSRTNTPPASGNPLLYLADCTNPYPGSPFAMSFHSWIGTPGDYVTGARYTHSKLLDCGVTYQYHFEATDTSGRKAPATPTLTGPEVYGWRQMSPALSPSPRHLFAMAFDAESGVTVLFGGQEDGNPFLSDTWAYDHRAKTWYNMAPAVHPPGAVQFASSATYDSAHDRIIALIWPAAPYLPAMVTWEYDYNTNTWTDRSPASEPGTRIEFTIAYDTANRKTILFGGQEGVMGSHAFDDTWAYDYDTNTWTEMAPSTHPSARGGYGLAYDPTDQRVVLFGGRTYPYAYDYYSDTWAYDYAGNEWIERTPTLSPTARGLVGMAFDSRLNKIILFGGNDGTTYLGDTWSYTYGSNLWVQLSPDSRPPGPPRRWLHGLVFDSGCKVSVLFGGDDTSNNYLDDTWTFVAPP